MDMRIAPGQQLANVGRYEVEHMFLTEFPQVR
jgi:hypothetical protein